MKKTLFILISILIILLSTTFIFLKNNIDSEKDIMNFNTYYESYLDKHFFGAEVATIISKAMDNNEKYARQKDERDFYISDNKFSVRIFLKIVGSNKIYEMETINKVGISEFISNFNVMTFTCTDIKYHHETKRVSEMYIEEVTF